MQLILSVSTVNGPSVGQTLTLAYLLTSFCRKMSAFFVVIIALNNERVLILVRSAIRLWKVDV